jgi:hypothetical protein
MWKFQTLWQREVGDIEEGRFFWSFSTHPSQGSHVLYSHTWQDPTYEAIC